MSCGTVHATVKPVGETGDHPKGESHSARNEQLLSFQISACIHNSRVKQQPAVHLPLLVG